MLNRIEYTADNYKKELMPIGEHVYNLDFFKENKVVTLVDIIPHFIKNQILMHPIQRHREKGRLFFYSFLRQWKRCYLLVHSILK